MRTVKGGGDKKEGQFWGQGVELIEWRSIDLHSIYSKSTFCPPKTRAEKALEGMHPGNKAVLFYWCYGKHILMVKKRKV